MKHPHSHRASGFTVIELLVIIVIIGVASVLFFIQKNNLESANRDEKRKVATNAIYYNLEEVFYPKYGYYPLSINEKSLTAMDPALLTDTNGLKPNQTLEDADSLSDEDRKAAESYLQGAYEYKYEPSNCDNEGRCKSYTIRVQLEREAEYVKKSRRS